MKPKIADALNFYSTLSPTKIVNAFQLISSYYFSRLINKPIHWGKLAAIAFEPTTSCNLRCPQCPSGIRSFTRPTGNLDQTLFYQTIDEIKSHLMYLTFYFQGEPYLNPKFLEMVAYANQKNIYTSTSTNAHYLDQANAKATVESGLNRIIISIDGTAQDTFQKYRVGGKLDKVIEGTKNLIEWKKKLKSSTPHILFQFIVMKHNEHQIEEIKSLAKTIGVDELQLKTAQIYDYEHGSDLLPTNEKYSRYHKSHNSNYEINNQLLNHCWKMWHSCVITWDGSVVPCCFDKDASNSLGQLSHEKLSSIWKNKLYQNFRTRISKSRKEIEICKNCSEGTKIFQ
ncbi:MAG: radical SAM protein [Cytophagales bacterium]|nr:MAG: radical SAM protein [Cytophagales bacterium]